RVGRSPRQSVDSRPQRRAPEPRKPSGGKPESSFEGPRLRREKLKNAPAKANGSYRERGRLLQGRPRPLRRLMASVRKRPPAVAVVGLPYKSIQPQQTRWR